MRNKWIVGILAVTLIILGVWVYRTVSEVKVEQEKTNYTQPGTGLASNSRRSEGGAVTVEAVLLNAGGQMPADEAAFSIALNTHSVALENYDVAKNAVLKSSDGVIADKGFTWEAQTDSSHHRSGVLRIKGDEIIGPETAVIILELRNLAGIPVREFKWELTK